MKKILVAVDFSDVTDSVLEAACAQATATKAMLKVVHVSAPDPAFVGYGAGPIHEIEFRAKTLREEKERLVAMAEKLKERGVEAVAQLIEGPTADVLIREIEDNDFDLLVMGSHGHGALFNLVVGSVTQALLHRSRIPVLVVPSRKD